MEHVARRGQLRRIGMLVFAILHWTLFAIYLWPERAASWNYSNQNVAQLARMAPRRGPRS